MYTHCKSHRRSRKHRILTLERRMHTTRDSLSRRLQEKHGAHNNRSPTLPRKRGHTPHTLADLTVRRPTAPTTRNSKQTDSTRSRTRRTRRTRRTVLVVQRITGRTVRQARVHNRADSPRKKNHGQTLCTLSADKITGNAPFSEQSHPTTATGSAAA